MPPSASIVYCPRTHAAFGHPPHPFRDFLARGTRVALGTDSLASNRDLDMLAEARFVHRKFPEVPGATLLKMATLNGASVLTWGGETGSLTPGKSADLVIVPLPNITHVFYGREVGYVVERIVLDDVTEAISATQARKLAGFS